jgi:hypothetical protein
MNTEHTFRPCLHCGGDLSIRNPTGECDHLYYPDYCEVCKKLLETQDFLSKIKLRLHDYTFSEFGELPFVIDQATVEVIPTHSSAKDNGCEDCNWFHVILFDNDKKIFYYLGEHDGMSFIQRSFVNIKHCRIHDAFSIQFSKLKLTDDGSNVRFE